VDRITVNKTIVCCTTGLFFVGTSQDLLISTGLIPSDDQDHSAPVILANSGGLSTSVTVITTNAISGEEYIVPPRDTKPKDESEPQSPWR
jgi:hypothetical protein